MCTVALVKDILKLLNYISANFFCYTYFNYLYKFQNITIRYWKIQTLCQIGLSRKSPYANQAHPEHKEIKTSLNFSAKTGLFKFQSRKIWVLYFVINIQWTLKFVFFLKRPQNLTKSSPSYLLRTVKPTVKISSIFVAFLENMIFM